MRFRFVNTDDYPTDERKQIADLIEHRKSICKVIESQGGTVTYLHIDGIWTGGSDMVGRCRCRCRCRKDFKNCLRTGRKSLRIDNGIEPLCVVPKHH